MDSFDKAYSAQKKYSYRLDTDTRQWRILKILHPYLITKTESRHQGATTRTFIHYFRFMLNSIALFTRSTPHLPNESSIFLFAGSISMVFSTSKVLGHLDSHRVSYAFGDSAVGATTSSSHLLGKYCI